MRAAISDRRLEAIAGEPDAVRAADGAGTQVNPISPTVEATIVTVNTVRESGAALDAPDIRAGATGLRLATISTNYTSLFGWIGAVDTDAGTRYPVTSNTYEVGRFDVVATRTTLTSATIWASGQRGDVTLTSPYPAVADGLRTHGRAPLVIAYARALSDIQVAQLMAHLAALYSLSLSLSLSLG